MKFKAPLDNRMPQAAAESDGIWMPLMMSAVMHFFVLGLFIAAPNFYESKDLPAGAISVNLVSVPSFTSAAPPGKKSTGPAASEMVKPVPKVEAPSKKEPIIKAPDVVAPPPKETVIVPPPKEAPKEVVVAPAPKAPEKDAISLAPKAAIPKESLKKKTYQASKIVESAIKRIEKETEVPKTDTDATPDAARKAETGSLKDALDRMRSAVEQKESGGGGGTSAARGGGGGTTEGAIGQDASGAGGGLGGTGKSRPLELIDIYRVEIAHYIQKNWAYSEQMSEGRSNLTAWVMVEITRQGEIRDFWFEKRSGSAYLDESAARAIQKSNPLPPFPPGVTQSTIHQGFRFTPTGIK